VTGIDELDQRLAELQAERGALVSARTKEATAQAAQSFLEAAGAHSQGLGGLVIEGHAAGQPLDDVLRAFLLSDPRLEGWLVEQAQQFAELTEKAKAAKLRKLGDEIEAATAALREERKAAAIAAVEAEFADAAA
jgi:hypothetical protein